MADFIKWLMLYIVVLAISSINTYFYCRITDMPFNYDIMFFITVIIFTLKAIIEIAIYTSKDSD